MKNKWTPPNFNSHTYLQNLNYFMRGKGKLLTHPILQSCQPKYDLSCTNFTHLNRKRRQKILLYWLKSQPLLISRHLKKDTESCTRSQRGFLVHSRRPKVSGSSKHIWLVDLAPKWCIKHFLTTNIIVKIVSDTKDGLRTD